LGQIEDEDQGKRKMKAGLASLRAHWGKEMRQYAVLKRFAKGCRGKEERK